MHPTYSPPSAVPRRALPRIGLFALVLGAMFVLASCKGGAQLVRHEAGEGFAGTRATASATGAKGAGDAPAFNELPCSRFALNDRSLSVKCGYVSVPEDRSRPDGRTLQLAVAVISSDSAEPDSVPLVWLEGGPGGASIDEFQIVLNTAAGRAAFRGKDLLADRDLVIFDQRGTGHSKPSLGCPELKQFNNPASDPRATDPNGVTAATNATLACRDRLRADEIDLAAYTSSENAADVNDIRRALGYEQVNLYGNSYGTRLALTVMRDFPDMVRSAVLDSVLPLQVDLYADVFLSAQRSLDLFFQGCAADAACRTAYPSLDTVFYDLVARLNTSPLPLTGTNPLTGRPNRLTGDALLAATFQLLYATPIYPLLPGMIWALRDGNAAAFALAAQQSQTADLISFGLYYSIQCGEEVVFSDAAARDANRHAVRPAVAAALGPVLTDPLFAVCPEWGARRALPRENEPVQSTIPTLILSGQYDPITPPDYAAKAAETLPNSTVFTFPATGHVTLVATDPCPYQIAWAFLRDPRTRPDDGCIAAMKGPAWVTRR